MSQYIAKDSKIIESHIKLHQKRKETISIRQYEDVFVRELPSMRQANRLRVTCSFVSLY